MSPLHPLAREIRSAFSERFHRRNRREKAKEKKKGKNKTRVASQKKERTNTKERGGKEKRMEWKKLNVKGVKKFQRQSID